MRVNYWSILLYHYLLPQKGWSWLIFPDQSEALGGAIAPIASPIAACLKETLPPYLIFSQVSSILDRKQSTLHARKKILFISLKNYDFGILGTKMHWINIFKIQFGALHKTGKIPWWRLLFNLLHTIIHIKSHLPKILELFMKNKNIIIWMLWLWVGRR